jgi:hypothetical protein
MITKPDGANYPPHKCEWGYRNPRNHLSLPKFKSLLLTMIEREDQRIVCPGCGREIYLNLKIESHNKVRSRKDLRPARSFIEDR